MTQLINELINQEAVCRAAPGFARVCHSVLVGYLIDFDSVYLFPEEGREGGGGPQRANS